VNQSGQANAGGGTSAGDDPASRHPSRLNCAVATGGRGLQSTPGVSRLTPADSGPAAHDYTTRPHAEGPTEMHVNSRLTTEHTAANCMSLLMIFRLIGKDKIHHLSHGWY